MLRPHPRSGPAFNGLRIGLLGGSFNPAHAGHLAMSIYALKRLGLDQIWWLVSPQNPLKSRADMAPFASRVAAARLIAAHPRIKVTDIEARLGTRYTVDTLRALRRRFPGARFVWLMGADNLAQMPRWKQWPEIFRRVPVAVFRRSFYSSRNSGIGGLPDVAADSGFPPGRGPPTPELRGGYVGNRGPGKAAQRFGRAMLAAAEGRVLARRQPPAWLMLDNPLNRLSATAIRKGSAQWQKQRQ